MNPHTLLTVEDRGKTCSMFLYLQVPSAGVEMYGNIHRKLYSQLCHQQLTSFHFIWICGCIKWKSHLEYEIGSFKYWDFSSLIPVFAWGADEVMDGIGVWRYVIDWFSQGKRSGPNTNQIQEPRSSALKLCF